MELTWDMFPIPKDASTQNAENTQARGFPMVNGAHARQRAIRQYANQQLDTATVAIRRGDLQDHCSCFAI